MLTLSKFASKLESRIIYRRDNKPYLTRYYIFRKPVKWLPSIYLHQFHSSDEDYELHNHPWDHSISFILFGSYKEEYREGDSVLSRILNIGNFNYVKKNKFHRIELQTKEVWTIFISGRKVQNWGFWDRHTKKFVSWQKHEQAQQIIPA